MKSRTLRPPTWCALAALTCLASLPVGAASPAREYLNQARSVTTQIHLAGDQSAALQAIASTLVPIDAPAALDLVGHIRRPTDGARALGSVAVAVNGQSPDLAAESAANAGKLLLRIADPDQRAVEQRLLLREIAPLGERALAAAPELGLGEARFEVLTGLAESDPEAALALLQQWQLRDDFSDQVSARIAEALAEKDPEQAIAAASGIISARWRDTALWHIAERRPPAEAVDIALRVSDPVVRSHLQTSAALRLTKDDPERAVAIARTVEVAPESALAEVAAAIARSDVDRALTLVRDLSEPSRTWALRRVAVEAAASRPDLTQKLLAEDGYDPVATRLALERMATVDLQRAQATASGLSSVETRDQALSVLVPVAARSDPSAAEDILWQIQSPRWRSKAAEPLALALIPGDPDGATSLLGLVNDPSQAARIRARMAISLAARDPNAAARLLQTLPTSDYRCDAAVRSAEAALAAGGQPDTAMQLGAAGMNSDLALRWAIPCLAQAQTRSPLDLANRIVDPYLQALALVDISRELTGLQSRVRSAPERATQVRCISEWQGR